MAQPNSTFTLLNGICPYFTMFPLSFPLKILQERGEKKEWVLDPFCGRGTTNFAARLLGMGTVGIDSSPVAAAISQAKLACTTPEAIVAEAKEILSSTKLEGKPGGEFWELAYHAKVLDAICRLRIGLMQDSSNDARCALRGIILGSLHGPKQRSFPSYFSNQCTRTYAPKPRYAVNYWQKHCMLPEAVDVMEVIERRARRYFSLLMPKVHGLVYLADSRDPNVVRNTIVGRKVAWVITSPPYYGMQTYIPDQWLRNWFLGGPESVQYVSKEQVQHTSPLDYVQQLRMVWTNIKSVCQPRAHLVIRFGGIRDRNVDPTGLIKLSLKESGWRLLTLCNAGTALSGKRQALTFLPHASKPVSEVDAWAILHE